MAQVAAAAQKDPKLYSLDRHYTTGEYFVTFLATRFGGIGIPRLQERFGELLEDIAVGQSFEAAFEAQMGISLATAEQAFLDYLRRTAQDPEERLGGTPWEDSLKARGTSSRGVEQQAGK